MADKIYLDQSGLERLVSYIKNELSQKADKGDAIELPEDLVYEADLADYAKKSEVVAQLPNDLVYDADIADVVREADLAELATKDELEAVEAKATSAYHVKGSVANIEALQAIVDPEQGDVYNLEDTGINAVWTGSEWDELGTFVDISPLQVEAEVYPISQATIDAILYSGAKAVVSDSAGVRAMVANDEPEVEISLIDDMTTSQSIVIDEGKSVTLDLGGNDVSYAATRSAGAAPVFMVDGGELILKNGSVNNGIRAITVNNGGSLVIENVEVTSANDVGISVNGLDSSMVMNSGKVNAQESGVLITTNASFVMNGGEIECTDNCPIQGNGTVKPDDDQGHISVVMNGGKLTAHITSAGYIACGVYMPNSGSFIMNGGEIESDGAGLVMRAGEVELNGGSIVAKGASGVKGKVGDSKVTVGPYAVIYDESAKYPGAANGEFSLLIGANMDLQGTDGDLDVLLSEGASANIIDNR